ncbi:glycosyltransferase family 2 protein [Neobacillus rhizophilus]|uniref:Glycosyltransferase n=1 Tax=Neobacillus rhizophilus TaxID=2833579 RepID=A0A942U4B8_9BACI|nr:glycosyltransferase [Neobacillus rhizophilus]MBS4212617.1 glycosyltransferase [Neobacillus rhizophilus]MBU8915025.1 glycosyltransferase [Bacillus sp. FJAT-29953]
MDNSTAKQLLDMLQAANEGISKLESCLNRGELSESDLNILDTMAEGLETIQNLTAGVSLPHRVKEINANILFYMEQLKQHVINKNSVGIQYDFKYHFRSLFRILEFEIAYIVENFVNKHDYPRLYPEIGTVDHGEIVARGDKARIKVSVILLGYNNLKYTRDCLESILANMDDVDYELILVDNGSTDGTKEYFESIPGAKVIYLKYNVHLVKGFNMGLMAAEGKYCAAVCNDFIFTPNWLKNLLICIEADSEIGFVSPGTTSISNYQQISIPFISIEDFQEKAREYNVSDPSKWEERVVLLPNVLCCPTALLERIGYYDTRYYRGEFLDDDLSFRIRRAGYKLVYCADTATHHYGSITTASDHQTNSLEEGRQTFLERYGFDSWSNAHINPAYTQIDFGKLAGVKSILGLDVKCGATLLQIKNRLWSKYGIKPQLSVCTTDSKYVVDLNTISPNVFVLENLHRFPEELNGKIDLAFIEKPLDVYSDDLDTIFKSLSTVMDRNGKLIFMVNNTLNIDTLYEIMITSKSSKLNHKIYFPDMIGMQARKYGFELSSINNFLSHFSPEREKVSYVLTHLFGSSEEIQMEQLKSLFLNNVLLYQMDYQPPKQ